MAENLNVSIKTIQEIVKLNLQIPKYQRPYTWGKNNVDKMIEDFHEFLEKAQYEEYYMGSLILHHDDEKEEYNIIDGQQRITTLMLLSKLLDTRYYRDLSFSNVLSHEKIRENYEYLSSTKDNIEKIKDIFKKIRFTVILTTNVDDAFIFFDTQNSRGVQPSVLVLLKTFHLRSISLTSLQKHYAKDWDSHERDEKYRLPEMSQKLEWLILIYLYRLRKWRGNKKGTFGTYDDFRDSWTKELRNSQNNSYKKFANLKNQQIITDNYTTTVKSKENEEYIFYARQPIYQGVGFFEFLNYSARLLDEVMQISLSNGKTIEELSIVYKTGSIFIESFFLITVLAYYDKFGKHRMNDFIEILDSYLYDIRMRSVRILKQSLEKNFIRCEHEKIEQNIFDIIYLSYDAQDVIDNLEIIERNAFKEYIKKSPVRKKFHEKYNSFWSK